MRRSIGEYHSLLASAVSALERDDAEAREDLYERARVALRAEFDKLDPPPSEIEILEERLKLNLAIHDFEWSFEWSIAAEVAQIRLKRRSSIIGGCRRHQPVPLSG
jgi:hypothetical protein